MLMRRAWHGAAVIALVALSLCISCALHAQGGDDFAAFRKDIQRLQMLNNYAEAVRAAEQYLTRAREKHGGGHVEYATAIFWLINVYQGQNRTADATALLERSVASWEKLPDPPHQQLAAALNDLSALYARSGRYREAEALLKRAIDIYEQALGRDHTSVATCLNNLGELYRNEGRLPEAEPLYKAALSIYEGALGRNNDAVRVTLLNLAELHGSQGRQAESETLLQQSQAIRRSMLDRSDFNRVMVAKNWNDMTLPTEVLGRFAQADEVYLNYIRILTHSILAYGNSVTSDGWREVDRDRARKFVDAAWALTAYGRDDSKSTDTFRVAQWVNRSGAADSLALMAARGAKRDERLASLVRERQDLVAKRVSRTTDEQADQRLTEIDALLKRDFPEYVSLTKPQPLLVDEVRPLLGADEALVQILVTSKPAAYVWVVTKTSMRWARSDGSIDALSQDVAALRCGLDVTLWDDHSNSDRCRSLRIGEPQRNAQGYILPETMPFDTTRAHTLYKSLFGQVEDLIEGKHLLIVPSGPLTQIPLQVLVTQQLDPAVAKNEAFRHAAWFAKSNAITVLPSVPSLKALREYAKVSQATKPFLGFGNPLLQGRDTKDEQRAELARAREHCSRTSLPRLAQIVGRGTIMPQQRGGLVDVADIRAQVPLPETADELCAVARSLGVPESEVWLGPRANERELKRLSESGDLATYRIVHFATHGALAGELKAGAEPGLILTPPPEATPEDDGYLSASEVAGLKLDADWVILSACNTAAGGIESADALSGLSRAFFYAGARALLVSHWAVDSDATVKLITKSLSDMAADKSIGRSEALRRSMVALIEQGEPREAHPTFWAPFVVVGEGAAGVAAMPSSPVVKAVATSAVPAASPKTTQPAVQPPTAAVPKKAAAKPRPKTNAADWKKTIFER
jgi:CHAT domain-containing protein/tetratricopeptide (TPR) repeat protein